MTAEERSRRREACWAMIDAADHPAFDAAFERLARRAAQHVLRRPPRPQLVENYEDARGE